MSGEAVPARDHDALGNPRVVLADEHPTLRASVRGLLERDGFDVCGEAGSAEAAVERALEERPDVCLLEVLLPGGGIWATARIAEKLPHTAIVMLTASRDREHLFDAVRAGAAGYLLKDMNPTRIPHALRGVLEGEAAIPRALVATLVTEFQSQGRRRMLVGRRGRADLTRREWEVLELMRAGLSTREMAGRLFLAPVTVRRHVSSLLDKLGVEDRAAAVALLENEDY